MIDPAQFHELPGNAHGLAAGALLFATDAPIVAGGGTSRAFVHEQGGDDETFVFLLGGRRVADLLGNELLVIEGVFLSQGGPGFHPTWGFEQLLREVTLGGWKVIPTAEVLTSWTAEVERRMNA